MHLVGRCDLGAGLCPPSHGSDGLSASRLQHVSHARLLRTVQNLWRHLRPAIHPMSVSHTAQFCCKRAFSLHSDVCMDGGMSWQVARWQGPTCPSFLGGVAMTTVRQPAICAGTAIMSVLDGSTAVPPGTYMPTAPGIHTKSNTVAASVR